MNFSEIKKCAELANSNISMISQQQQQQTLTERQIYKFPEHIGLFLSINYAACQHNTYAKYWTMFVYTVYILV